MSGAVEGATNGTKSGSVVPTAISPPAETPATEATFQIPKDLAIKLAKARKGIDAAAKNGTVHGDTFSYNYVRAEDVIEAASKALSEADLIVLPPVPTETEWIEVKGGSGYMVRVTFSFMVVDGETGDAFTRDRIGTASDYPGDKAIYKAETGATKYFLASLLGMALGDGSDPETSRPSGGNLDNDTQKATEGQKKYARDLLTESRLPKPAMKKVIDWMGGKEPTKARTSRVIEMLKDGNGLELAKECGWEGEVETNEATPAAETTPPAEASPETSGPADDPTPIPAPEAEALLKLCREKGCKQGEVVTFLTTVGVAVPEGDALTKESLQASIGKLNKVQAAKFESMVVSAAQAKEAATAASTEATTATKDEATTEVPAETPPVAKADDPNSPIGEARKAAERIGFAHEFDNVAWLLFDTENIETVSESGLQAMTGLLERAHLAGISVSSLGACTRQAREAGGDVRARSDQFEGWIKGREEKANNVAAADEAAKAAEASQE